MAQASDAVGFSRAKVGHMETGRNYQQPDEIVTLMRYYGADTAETDRLASLAGSAGRRAWWAPWTEVVPDWLKTFVGLEGMASHVTWYAPSVVPALLQTQAYSLGVTTGSGRVRPDHDERTVSLRLERQRRLVADDDPLHLTVLLEESVLDRPIGDTETMRGQLRHLLTMAERDNVELRLLPTAIGKHDALIGEFTLLDFDAAQSIVYVEIANGAVYVEEENQVEGYTRIADRVRAVALTPERTVEAVESRLHDLT